MVMSFEVSKRLKEAGYPQPEYAFGQHWYSDLDLQLISLRRDGAFIAESSDSYSVGKSNFRGVVKEEIVYYAPPVEELLKRPFFNVANVGFDMELWLWRVKVSEALGWKVYPGYVLSDLLGTLLAEHLEKENDAQTNKSN